MSIQDLLNFYFPFAKSMNPEAVDAALQIASDYRPACLSEREQDSAQALYAAYLLEDIQKRESGASVVSAAGPLIREKEGQLERQYADLSKSSDGSFNDNSFYSRWQLLNDRCAFGGPITRFGFSE